jgi:hypothetical protein
MSEFTVTNMGSTKAYLEKPGEETIMIEPGQSVTIPDGYTVRSDQPTLIRVDEIC